MQIFQEKTTRKNIFILKELPLTLTTYQGKPAVARFQNNESCIRCLGCLNPRCIYFSESDIECTQVSNFPNNKSVYACPVEAIAWDDVSFVPTIDLEKCIRCGICISRCPVGALYFSNEGEPTVNIVPEKVTENKDVDSSASTHIQQIEGLLKVPRYGSIINISDQLFEYIYDKLIHLDSNFHNTVGRNLLIALGCKCAMRRIGDIYTRMDAIYSSRLGSFGAVEIEFGRDTLDASRGILDDIAVLNTRYGIPKTENKPIVICLQLPNARQGYWQVVRDVKIVEGIKIGTVTIGALMLLLWNRCIFEPENDRYYIDYDNMDLRHILCEQIELNDITLSDKELGIVEPLK